MSELKTVTVACTQRDPKVFLVKKYWNENLHAVTDSGVYNARSLRKTSPDVKKLTPLAEFLFMNSPTCVAGKNKPDIKNRVTVISKLTEAETLRKERKFSPEITENMIRAYDLSKVRTQIDAWLFDIIEPDQTDEHFWNKAAINILKLDPRKIKISGKIFYP